MTKAKAKASGGGETTTGKEQTSAPPLNEAPIIGIPFRHNPIHDLESVFWVSIWILLCSEYPWKPDSKMTEDQWKGYLIKHGQLAAKLFCDTDYRRDVMVANSISTPGLGFESSRNRYLVVKPEGVTQVLGPADKERLAAALWDSLLS